MNKQMKKPILSIAGLTICCFLLAGNVFAQSRHYSAKSMGMGGGGTAYQDGYHANFINPANLLLNDYDAPRFSIGLLGGLSSTAGGPLMNISAYNKYFTTGSTITEQAIDDWFGANSVGNKRMGFETDVIPLAMMYRSKNWAVSAAVRGRVLMDYSMSKGFAQLALLGLDETAFATPKPVNLSGNILMFNEASVGFAYKLWEGDGLFGLGHHVKIYGGVAPKLLFGMQGSSFNLNSTLQINNDKIVHNFRYTMETIGSTTKQLNAYYHDHSANPDTSISDYLDPQAKDAYSVKGGGIGLDLGFTGEMDLNSKYDDQPKKFRFAVSLTDLGSIDFTKQAGVFQANDKFVWEGFKVDYEKINANYDSFGDYVNHVVTDSIGEGIYANFKPQNQSDLKRKLPTMLNIGGNLIWGKWSAALDYGTGFVNRGMNTGRSSLALGAQYKLFNHIPLRIGMRTGGMTSTTYTAGAGVEFRNFEFNLAAMSVSSSKNHGYNLGFAWGGLVFRF